MPLKQTTKIIENIEGEFKVLKEFSENKENQSISLLDLINSEKSKELLNETKNLQRLGAQNQDLKIRQTILALFQAEKQKGLIKKLEEIIGEYKKLTNEQDKNKLIAKYKKSQELADDIKYVYLRIIHREKDIKNLAKFKQLTSLSSNNVDHTGIIINHLQEKLNDTGLQGKINFNNLTILPNWEQELEEIKQKFPPPKIRPENKAQSTSTNPIIPPKENSFEIKPENSTLTLNNTTGFEETIKLDTELLPSWQAFAEQLQHIIQLEKALDFLSKEDDLLRIEKNDLEKEVMRLQDVEKRLNDEKLQTNSRDSVLTTFRSLRLPAINDLTKEKLSLKQDNEELKKVAEKISLELESTKKLLKETQDNLSEKNVHLEEIDIQLKETQETVSQLKKLQSDLNTANEKVNELNVKTNNLEAEIAVIQAEKSKLEDTLKNLDNTLQSNNSESQKALVQATETIQELNEKIETNSNAIKNKESEINTLKTELTEIIRKSEQLEKRNHTLEDQTAQLEQHVAQLTIESNKVTDERTALHQALTEAKEKIGILEREINNQQNKLEGFSENSIADNKKISELKSQLDSLNNSNEETQAYIDKLTDQKKTLDKEIIELKESSKEASEIIASLENEKKNLKETLQLKQQTFSQAKDEKNNLLDKLDKLSKTDSSNQEIISKLESQIKDLVALKLQHEQTILELKTQITDKDIKAEDLKTKNKEKMDQLATQVAETQERLDISQTELDKLKIEQTITNKQKIAKLDKLKAKHEQSILELKNQITDKEANLEALSLKLTTADQQAQEYKKTINSLKAEKLTLENKLEQLEQKNGELQQKLDQASATKDALLTELQQEKISNEKKLQQLRNQLKDLEKNLKNKQTTDSALEKEYANLKDQFAEQNQELTKIKADLETSNTQLKATHTELENLKASENKEGFMKDGKEIKFQPSNPNIQREEFGSLPDLASIKVDPTITASQHSDSSGHGSRDSLSPDFNEDKDLIDFLSDKTFNNGNPIHKTSSLLSVHSDFSADDAQSLHDLHDNSAKKKLVNTTQKPSVMNTSPFITTSEHQGREATLEEIKLGVNAAFQPQNHPAIIEAFTNKFLQIATSAASKVLKDNVNNLLPSFESKLKQIASDQITHLVFPYINSPEFKSKISEKIHTSRLLASNLEEVINSAESIFDNLSIGGEAGKPAQNYKDNIADQGKKLLFKLCIENLRTNERDQLIDLAKNKLEKQANDNNLQVTGYTETIQSSAEELVTKLLKPSNLQNTLEEMAKHPIVDLNLLDASKRKLQDQVEQQINQNIDHYFPNLQLDPILEKINNGKALSDEEIAKLPSELQYADTIEEFVAGLRVAHPNLPPNYENQLNEDTFKQLRLILRKNALHGLALDPEANEIMNLNAEKWLEKKVQLVTKKSSSLKLDKKQQKYLDKKFQKLFMLSPLETLAITHKSADELKKELKKLHDLKLDATVRLSKTFAEIEPKLPEYPNLITKDGTFQANLNNSLPLNAPNLSATQIQTILAKINHHLENDINKWNLLNNNKIAQEIAADIISDPINPFDPEIDIQTLVSNSLAILYKFHDLQDTLNKRKQWHTEIQQLYALTQKLKTSSQFNQEIEDRVNKLEDMLGLKENDADENLNAFPKGVYLPHKCRLISNSQLDSSDTEEYHLQVGDFYKQEALKVGKTVTFAQKLSDEGECKWSATLNNEKCLSFKTQKKFFRREKSYLQEVSFAQMIYSVNSFKNAKTCTLNFGNCSQNIKEQLYLFAKAYNELRLEDNELQKRPKINCNIKNPPDLDKAKIAAVKEEIKAQLSLRANELEDIASKLKDDDTMRHQIIRSRG